ncbi:protein of unknown function [Methylorubrum extorquens]|uniref:Uncharacterized protein n=1 Tax=Methylorubrum extorquens TaxID=408 RepID=A0A2N9ASP2_METEX|nr:protein of unknown function [Methylorubrum extorquens]
MLVFARRVVPRMAPNGSEPRPIRPERNTLDAQMQRIWLSGCTPDRRIHTESVGRKPSGHDDPAATGLTAT